MSHKIPVRFQVPEDYCHVWMLYGNRKVAAMILVEGKPELELRTSREADEMMSEVLDWQFEVMARIEGECKALAEDDSS